MKKILIVDDNLDIVEVTRLMLAIQGYNVLGITVAKEVIGMVRSFRPDLIILDVMLGDTDGRDICHHLKTTSDTKLIPILMFSAVHSLSSVIENRCEADDFISKPFDIQTMTSKVEGLVGS